MSAAPTILVTGATGFLGRQVCTATVQKGFRTVGTSFSRDTQGQGFDIVKLDLNDEAAITATLDSVKPAAVIHCAAARFPEDVDQNPDRARLLNVVASQALARGCAERDAMLIYLSTDYVFNGRKDDAHLRPYGAHSAPSPANLYGQTKLDGERVVLDQTSESGRGYVLRVPVLYGPAQAASESSINILLQTVQQATDTVVATDDYSIRYPTCTVEVARVLADLVATLLERRPAGSAKAGDETRVFGFTSEEGMTKYAMCRRLAALTGSNWENIRPAAGGVAGRPYDCHLDTSALKHIGVDVRHVPFDHWWREALSTSEGVY